MVDAQNSGARGMVFDIQRYSIHDGPGIRTLIFLKGCPLRCLWCANPESWSPEPQLFYVHSKCIHCGECVRTAPNNGITMDEQGELKINFPLLNKNDFAWVKNCPTGALQVKGRSMTTDEVFQTVLRDEIFYRQSGGGITLSGGEPLLQTDFAKDLLLRARQDVVSTVIETSGGIPLDTLLTFIHYVDLFLYDFKIFDNDKHLQYTGLSNNSIKENLKALIKERAEVLVRMPLIPGINDSSDDMKKTLDYLKDIGVKRFTVLPYHQYGSGKYVSIGGSYSLAALSPPDKALVETLKNQLAEAGFSME
jgi:pyruvate formate lyase activating enzyme